MLSLTNSPLTQLAHWGKALETQVDERQRVRIAFSPFCFQKAPNFSGSGQTVKVDALLEKFTIAFQQINIVHQLQDVHVLGGRFGVLADSSPEVSSKVMEVLCRIFACPMIPLQIS